MFKHSGLGSDVLVIFDQIHCVLILQTFYQKIHSIDFDNNLSESHTQHWHSCEEKNSWHHGGSFSCNLQIL